MRSISGEARSRSIAAVPSAGPGACANQVHSQGRPDHIVFAVHARGDEDGAAGDQVDAFLDPGHGPDLRAVVIHVERAEVSFESGHHARVGACGQPRRVVHRATDHRGHARRGVHAPPIG